MRSGLTIPKLLGVCLAFQHKKGGKTEDAVRADCDFLFVLRVIYIYIYKQKQEFLHYYF